MLNLKFAVTLLALCSYSLSFAAERSAEEILQEMASDYRFDPAATDITIGFDIDGDRWLLDVSRNRSGTPHDVTLTSVFPGYPIAYWVMSIETLRRIDDGMTGETATQRARAEDPRLMYLETTENYPEFLFSGDFWTQLMEFKIHFFSRGIPEVIPLAAEFGVASHGVNIAGIHYAPGLSVFRVTIPPNTETNAEDDLDTNPFETIWIATSGQADATIGSNTVLFAANNTLFIPAGVTHVATNPYDEPFESIMILFGDGLNE